MWLADRRGVLKREHRQQKNVGKEGKKRNRLAKEGFKRNRYTRIGQGNAKLEGHSERRVANSLGAK